MSASPRSDVAALSGLQVDRRILERIEAALEGLRFGAVEITVHDGRVVQVERREKYRFDARSRPQ